MKRAMVLLAVFLVLSTAVLPHPAAAGGNWHGHHGHGSGWWWPAAIVGGLALGAVAIATAPFWAFAPPPPVVTPPAAYVEPTYAVQSTYTVQPTYAAPATPAPRSSGPPPFKGEVVYPNGRYLLFGDGVTHPWQWVWVPGKAS